MYSRTLLAVLEKAKKSVLLLGPRQTGKSTLIRSLAPDLTINLARESTFLEFSSSPDLLERVMAQKKPKTIFIDEVQRIPSILNTVQAILDENPGRYKFYLTGSSARKLRRGQANLLPGRVLSFYFHPLTLEELGSRFDLDTILSYGSLPGILSETDVATRKRILNTYGATYLKEEVRAEALTKNIEGFSRFLFAAAAKNGEFLDYAKLGAQAAITQKTASRFFEILEDTLIVRRIEAFAKTPMRRLVQHPRFYFFDNGVLNSLLGDYGLSQDRKGMLFETFVVNQIHDLFLSKATDARFSTYRTDAGAELDLIVEFENRVLAIEIKASRNVGLADLRGFRSFSEIYKKKHEKIVIYLGAHPQLIEGVQVLPLIEAFKKMAQLIE